MLSFPHTLSCYFIVLFNMCTLSQSPSLIISLPLCFIVTIFLYIKPPQFFKLVLHKVKLLCLLTSSQWGFELCLCDSRSPFLDPFKGGLLYSLIQAQHRNSWVTAHTIWGIKRWWEHRNSKQSQKQPPTPISPSLLHTTSTHQARSGSCVLSVSAGNYQSAQ